MAIQTTDTALGTRTLKAPKCSDAKRNPKAPENKGMLRESQCEEIILFHPEIIETTHFGYHVSYIVNCF